MSGFGVRDSGFVKQGAVLGWDADGGCAYPAAAVG